jgi:hypothetical protein
LTLDHKSPVGFRSVWGVINGLQIASHIVAHFYAGHIVAGVLLQVKLAALPENTGKEGLTSCL